MKKFATILVMLFVLSVSAFADGEYPIANKSCPQNQTCLINGEIPIDNKSDHPTIESIFYFLKSILG